MSNVGVSVGDHLLQDWQILMIAVRMVDGLVYSKEKEVIDEMNGELTKIVEDFMHAVNVETLRQAKKSGKHSSQSGDGKSLAVSRRVSRKVPSRARAFACAAETRRGRLQLEALLYGRHPEIYS